MYKVPFSMVHLGPLTHVNPRLPSTMSEKFPIILNEVSEDIHTINSVLFIENYPAKIIKKYKKIQTYQRRSSLQILHLYHACSGLQKQEDISKDSVRREERSLPC